MRWKPIACVEAVLHGEVLTIGDSVRLEDFAGFERVVNSEGAWMAGIDFPFGQSRRLLASPVNIVPFRPNSDERIVVEPYPALVVRRFIGRLSYRNDTRSKQTEALRQARPAIVEGLGSDVFRRTEDF
jgi:hypothetical protein